MAQIFAKKVGDVVLVYKNNKVTTDNVSNVTPTGRFYINGSSQIYKPDGVEPGAYAQTVFPYSDEKLAELTKYQKDYEKYVADQKAGAQRKTAEREARHAAELAEVKLLVGELKFSYQQVCADGSRMYVLADIPIKPEYRQRKLQETLIIRCKDVEDFCWRTEAKIMKVEMACTYNNKTTSSFSSISTSSHATDEDAIWEAIRSRYNDSW